MKTPLSTLAKSAQSLAKNPLGIIALFIVFIYAFASLVVGFSSQLQPEQKTPLIWFLVVFPVLVLLVFGWLVSRHHQKLYGPGDYADEAHFLDAIRLLTPEEYAAKLNQEIVQIQQPVQPININIPSASDDTKPPEESTPTEIHELPSKQQLPLTQLREMAFVAEDLALRKMQQEIELPIQRNVMWTGSDSRDLVQFDAIHVSKRVLIGFEVKFFRTVSFDAGIIHKLLSLAQMVHAVESPRRVFKLALLAVTTVPEDKRRDMEYRLKSLTKNAAFPVHIRVYGLDELRAEFGIEDGQQPPERDK